MPTMPFLTDVDPRGAVKGSRDPLGMVPIWSHFGRFVVGNLTTASTSLRDFTISALGFTLIERLLESGHDESELPIFLRWEQLCGYARAARNNDRAFRGTERVHQALAEGDAITLSAERGHQILSNQKTYGIWGLYTVAARASGLIEESRYRPSPHTKDHADRMWWPLIRKALGGDGSRLPQFIAKPSITFDVKGRDAAIATLVAALIHPKLRSHEHQFYVTHLVDGGPDALRDRTSGRQRTLAELFRKGDLSPDEPLSPVVVASLAKQARYRYGRESELADRLEAIRTCELTFAPASHLFDWLQSQDGQGASDVARKVQKQWGSRLALVDAAGFRALGADIAKVTGSTETATHWQRIADTLAAGDYPALIESLLQLNRWVMQTRNGASPWIEVRSGRLHVRFQDALSELPERDELRHLWRNSYFLDPLRGMVATLAEGE